MAGDDIPQPSPYDEAARMLCRLDEIADGASKEVALNDKRSLCLVRQRNVVYAYVNSCPHTGAPLNWGKDDFLNWGGTLIQCSFHGALFRIDDGLCVWGPCVRQRLTPVDVTVREGEVLLTDTSFN